MTQNHLIYSRRTIYNEVMRDYFEIGSFVNSRRMCDFFHFRALVNNHICLNIYVVKIHRNIVMGKLMALQNTRILIPGIYEHAVLHGQSKLKLWFIRVNNQLILRLVDYTELPNVIVLALRSGRGRQEDW